jgi:nucleoside-diphosphate-sugar epimerase
MAKNILFLGGTGIISSACSPLVLENGDNLFLLNRGESFRQVTKGAQVIRADIRREPEVLASAIQKHKIDIVVDWIAFRPEDVQRDIDACLGHVEQYVFISSASAYKKPVPHLPISEATPLENPFWEYSRNKIACEALLLQALNEHGFPMTVVRPSHTYDRTLLPFHGGWTIVDRMRRGKPVIIHGDGTSLWVLTHHRDFAVGFVGLLGNPGAVGEVLQITSDELLTWNAIFTLVAERAGAELNTVHIPSDLIAKYDERWGASLLGDKAHSVIFDNSKIKRLVPAFDPKIPFSEGSREIIAWYDANPQFEAVDDSTNRLHDQIIADFRAIQA